MQGTPHPRPHTLPSAPHPTRPSYPLRELQPKLPAAAAPNPSVSPGARQADVRRSSPRPGPGLAFGNAGVRNCWYRVFKELDEDGTGLISLDDFARMVRGRLRVSRAELEDERIRAASQHG